MKFKRAVITMTSVALVLAAGGYFLTALNSMDSAAVDKGQVQLERSLRKAIAMEYASTGAYPANLDVLRTKYGVQIDEKKYYVIYMPSGENIAPRLEVIRLGEVYA